MEHEEYLKDLAQSLRWRRIDDRAVIDVLREVSSEAAETRSAPVDRFGNADQYAERFNRGRSMSLGLWVATTGAMLATLAAAAYVVSTKAGSVPTSLPRSLAVYGVCAALLVAAVLTGHRLDRRLPRDFRT
jgi:hypothetical protein